MNERSFRHEDKAVMAYVVSGSSVGNDGFSYIKVVISCKRRENS